MVVPFGPVGMSVLPLFGRRFADSGDFDLEVEGHSSERMVSVHGDLIAFDLGHGDDLGPLVGLGLELHPFLDLCDSFELRLGDYVHAGLFPQAIGFFGGDVDFEAVSYRLPFQGFFQSRDDVPCSMEIVERGFALRCVQYLSVGSSQRVVDASDLAIFDLHSGSPDWSALLPSKKIVGNSIARFSWRESLENGGIQRKGAEKPRNPFFASGSGRWKKGSTFLAKPQNLVVVQGCAGEEGSVQDLEGAAEGALG